MRFFVLLIIIILMPASVLALSDPAHNSGLPIPRFVTLKPDEVNVRTGPGTRYPIEWVYHRAGMPVEVIEEYDVWRKIRDMEGTSGWVHKSMLDGKHNVMIKGKEDRVLRVDPDAAAKPLLKAEPKVTGRLMECDPSWCRVQISGRKGWIEKKYLWGVYDNEVFD